MKFLRLYGSPDSKLPATNRRKNMMFICNIFLMSTQIIKYHQSISHPLSNSTLDSQRAKINLFLPGLHFQLEKENSHWLGIWKRGCSCYFTPLIIVFLPHFQNHCCPSVAAVKTGWYLIDSVRVVRMTGICFFDNWGPLDFHQPWFAVLQSCISQDKARPDKCPQ